MKKLFSVEEVEEMLTSLGDNSETLDLFNEVFLILQDDELTSKDKLDQSKTILRNMTVLATEVLEEIENENDLSKLKETVDKLYSNVVFHESHLQFMREKMTLIYDIITQKNLKEHDKQIKISEVVKSFLRKNQN